MGLTDVRNACHCSCRAAYCCLSEDCEVSANKQLHSHPSLCRPTCVIPATSNTYVIDNCQCAPKGELHCAST
ncbi:hypothetical protein FIBSPDRAFT_490025 [Athelia psychrophila]|uniref:Uncharacterized protein n=1 Tax=Athelia psychrophila TaxID=1759441 RepID=A0A167TUZ0_9AGAM|nr:hypothetical protein FIBSPDRAFT_490025 [Fibularhizoctonia sp. CBS 109695]